ncbi:hypothetical protein GF402_04315 [Candidatus Fermentibacteria bacterium]|nr:hypothetical protein [Candidatus Fermentibacteria bacterium]
MDVAKKLAELTADPPSREELSAVSVEVTCCGCGTRFASGGFGGLHTCRTCPGCGQRLFPLGESDTCPDIQALWTLFRLLVAYVIAVDEKFTWGERLQLQRFRRELVETMRLDIDPESLEDVVDDALATVAPDMNVEYAALMMRQIAKDYEFGRVMLKSFYDWLRELARSDGEVNFREDEALTRVATGFGIEA